MADTLSIQKLILNTPLRELPVTIPGWDKDENGNPVNLILRELDGHSGAALMNAVSDKEGNVNQERLVAGVILATLRNADDPKKALVFSADPVNAPDEYAPAFRDSLMSTGLGNIMNAAKQSIELSGLDSKQAVANAKNASSGTVVEGSVTALPAN